MNIQGIKKTGLAHAIAMVVALSTATIFGQDAAPVPNPASMAPNTATPPPPLSTAVSQVLQLSQAKIGDGSIITYIQNSGTSYGLEVSQIIYLKQQGVSENVINAMLNPRPVAAAPAAPAAQPDNGSSNATVAPAVAVGQSAPPEPSSVYVIPDTQTYYYDSTAYPYYYPYSYYGWPVTYSFGHYYGRHGGGGGFHGSFGGGGHPGRGGFHR